MSANPYNIWDEVDGDTKVEKIVTTITTIKEYDKEKLRWHDKEGYKYLTLNEILEQMQEHMKNECMKEEIGLTDKVVPFIRVEYESGLWGVIFEIGNYDEVGKQWIVHGITKGYA